jgi:pimeloyl-ACP methyl ester carboxylesterase
VLERLGRRCPSARHRRKNRPYGIAERAGFVQAGDGEATVPEALPFGAEPLPEIIWGSEQVYFLAPPHDHHRVREIDRQRLTEPAEDGPAPPGRAEPFHPTFPALHTLTKFLPEIVRIAGVATGKAVGVSFERRGAGEPLLLIHGTGGSRSHWKPVANLLSARRELVLVDLPGHGESDPPPAETPHTPIGYASVLADLLDQLDLHTADTAGNSVGGWTALELAKLGRARSVVAIGPAGLWAKRDPWRCTLQLSSQYRLGRLFAPLVPRLMRGELGRTLLLSGTVAKPRQMPAEAAIEMATTYARTPTFRAHLAATRQERFRDGQGIDVPVVVAWGDKDRLIPAKARRRDELPPQTRFVTLPECGHSPMWDDPELVATTILEGAAIRGSETSSTTSV